MPQPYVRLTKMDYPGCLLTLLDQENAEYRQRCEESLEDLSEFPAGGDACLFTDADI